MSDDIETLPDFDVTSPTTFQQVKETAGSMLGWIKQNQGDIMNGIEYLKSLRNNVIPSSANVDTQDPLPPL